MENKWLLVDYTSGEERINKFSTYTAACTSVPYTPWGKVKSFYPDLKDENTFSTEWWGGDILQYKVVREEENERHRN